MSGIINSGIYERKDLQIPAQVIALVVEDICEINFRRTKL
jgi:hypothetical protein